MRYLIFLTLLLTACGREAVDVDLPPQEKRSYCALDPGVYQIQWPDGLIRFSKIYLCFSGSVVICDVIDPNMCFQQDVNK